MSLFGGKPSTPQKPASKPGLFEKGRQPLVKELLRVKGPVVIPGTGGQKYYKQQYKTMLKNLLPYQKVKTHLKEWEAKNILRKMRKEEDRAHKPPSRERRTFEEQWGLKGKY